MSFQLVLKSVTFNNLERRNICFIALCDEERRPVAEFMRQSIAFCSTCTMSS